jgi:hypothetical protein
MHVRLITAVVLAFVVTTPALAQRKTAKPAPVAAPAKPATPSPVVPGFTYKAEARRDPFVSLARRG